MSNKTGKSIILERLQSKLQRFLGVRNDCYGKLNNCLVDTKKRGTGKVSQLSSITAASGLFNVFNSG